MDFTEEEITTFQCLYSEATGIALDKDAADEILFEVLSFLRWLHEFD